MSFWMQAKNDIKRLFRLDLHSYWEVFYIDLFGFLLSFVFSPPLHWIVDSIGASDQVSTFVIDNIVSPLEMNTVRQMAPSGLADCTYRSIAYGVVFLAEWALFHLMICAMFAYKKSHEVSIDSHEKVSICHRIKSELSRLWRLELHSCWELFYLDAMLVVFSILFSIPFTAIIYYFRLEKVTYEPYMNYIEKPLETAVIRPVVESVQAVLPSLIEQPVPLTDYAYEYITLLTIDLLIVIVFHCGNYYSYLSERKRKRVQTVDDVETGTCFPRSRVALKGEKKRRLEKVYQSLSAPTSSLSDDKVQLIKKAFP